ncbi:hypothetical protein [Treponema porcinum]|uniref:Uncharacterized protein n=1 Tax=Treponema porcinum TaxID=261392 RepID=A0A1T4L434_TREPO|nr:hypothetical protein [Treponema porcinum]SJZ49311.1 hypothetical protein SAMN02745149_01440 [Treponema porcinum]
MKKHNVFLLFTSITALLFCACSSELKEKENASSKPGTVTLSIANDTQRTISPASDISYKDVSEWTVTFEDITKSRSEKYNDIVKTVSFSESANQQIQLPLGTYNVTLNGTANNDTSGETATTQPVPFYGESTVTVENGKSASISVFVAPKKSDGGKGSFNFTVTTSGEFGNYTPIVSGNYFTVSLTPYGGENPVATWTPTEISHSASVTEAGSTYSFSVSSGTPESIPSGFYTLSIKYTWVVGEDSVGQLLTKTKEIFYPYHDFLVEIVDGLETKGSADITVSLEDSKTYYATKGETIGNGAFESMPKNLDELLVDINRTTISTANIYIVDEVLTDETSTSYPEIDVSKVNATGKTYCIYTKSEKTQEYNSTPCYTITGAAVEGDEPTIDIERSVTTVTLKNSQSSSGISGSAKIVALGSPEFVLKDNTSVFIDLTDQNNQIACTTICMPPDSTTFDSYYVENPCVTVKNHSTSSTSFRVSIEQSLSNSYSVVTNSSDDETYKTTNFYIIPSYATGVSVEGIPNYSLAVTKDGVDVTKGTLLYAGDTVVITATPEAGATFAQDTTFAWFVNGEQVEANKDDPKSCSIRIGVTGDSGVDNRIICLVGYNGEYATVQTTLTAVEQTALLYTKYGLGYAELASLNANPNLSWILSDAIISDFCIDTKTNDAYIIYAAGNGNPYIEKATYYHANTDMHYASVDYASSFKPNLIRMGNDNKLYVKFSLISDGMAFGIVDLLPNETGTQGAANIPQHLKMSEVSVTDQIMSFCVDDAGIMYITYKDSESNILLAKFSITEGVLTKQNSITLATISNTDNSVTSNYLPANISSNITITDMHYEDGYIYLIVRDVFIDYLTPTDSVRSLGGVCKIKAEDLTLADSTNPLIGWADTQLIITENVYNYKHNEETQNYFYGPQKIIAIKPKEIVIADDGASIENSKMHQENRVVLFNLETNSITGVKTSPKEFYFSTSGGDNTNYKPN